MTTTRDWDGPGGMEIGVGFDSGSANVRGDCVIRKAPEGSGGDEVYYTVDLVKSRTQMLKKLNISASASLKTAVRVCS